MLLSRRVIWLVHACARVPPLCRLSWWGWACNHPRIVAPPAFFTIALVFLVLALATGAAVAAACPALSVAAAVDDGSELPGLKRSLRLPPLQTSSSSHIPSSVH